MVNINNQTEGGHSSTYLIWIKESTERLIIDHHHGKVDGGEGQMGDMHTYIDGIDRKIR